MANTTNLIPRLLLVSTIALVAWVLAHASARASTVVPTSTATPWPTSTPTPPPPTFTPTATYFPPTPVPSNTPTRAPVATQFFYGAAEATAELVRGSPVIANVTAQRPTSSPAPTVSIAPGQPPPTLDIGAWIMPQQIEAEARMTAVEARAQASATALARIALTPQFQPTPSIDVSIMSAIPSKMKLAGPVQPEDGGDTPTGDRGANGLPLPPPIRYAGVPAQSTEAAWLDSSTLWLGVPHRSQFDGTLYAPTNCGPASLGMVFEAFGLKGYPTDAIRGEVNRLQGDSNPDDGTSLYAIAAVAQRAGLVPVGISKRWTLKDVRAALEQGQPVITLTRYADLPGNGRLDPGTNHYIVLTGVKGDQFIYNDPAYAQGAGRALLMPPETLLRAWADADIPAHAVAFALDASGAALLSPSAIRHLTYPDPDVNAAVLPGSDDAFAIDPSAAIFWQAVVQGIGAPSSDDPPALRAAPASHRPTTGGMGPASGIADPPPPMPWLALLLVIISLVTTAATITFAMARVIPAEND
ncbi:MAG TPA: C39 family peptidase [Chloroflexota bacterium]|nr:C39 family peptidase [Chloroflexota bacterium]